MSFSLDAHTLQRMCQSLVTVTSSNLGLEVQIPVVYPNGDFVTVVVTEQGGHIIVHDAGFGSMTLSTHGVHVTAKMHARLSALANHYGCEFIDGRMQRTTSIDNLPLAVTVIANASRTIADQLLHTPQQPVFSFRQEVIERVKNVVGATRVRENEAVIGKSGTEYNIGAVVLDIRRSRPIAFIEAVRDIEGVNKRFREFYDIMQAPVPYGADRIVLYDDRAQLRQVDLIILQDVSNVVRFSDANTRLRPLAEGIFGGEAQQ